MNKKPDWSLIAKYLSGECSESELIIVSNWLKADEDNKRVLESYKKIWTLKDPVQAESDIKVIWEKINETIAADKSEENELTKIYTIDKKKSSRLKIHNFVQYPVLRYAAVFLMVFSAVTLYYLYRELDIFNNRQEWEIVTVGNGEQRNITLSDGTKIILDSGSRLHYPETFPLDLREIKLEGEAYLEVVHNGDKPFKVISGNAIIEVLGTKFNVRNWAESEKVEVAVIEGRVALEDFQDIEEKIILDKGFVGSISDSGEFTRQEILNIKSYISWMQGEISFRDASLSEVLKQIERWYNVSFSLEDNAIAKDRLTIFVRKNSLNDVLDVLTTLTNTNAQLDGDVVYLSPEKEKRL